MSERQIGTRVIRFCFRHGFCWHVWVGDYWACLKCIGRDDEDE